MEDYTSITDDAALRRLGERVARHRLDRNLTQSQLADRAGVSKNTVYRLEAGESTQLTNLVRVLRALGLLKNLDGLVPEPAPSPLQQLKSQGKTKRRASGTSPSDDDDQQAPWSWGDDEEDDQHQQDDHDHDDDPHDGDDDEGRWS